MMICKRLLLLVGVVGLWFWPLAAVAQTEPPPPTPDEIPQVHVVQEGEFLVTIAEQYSTTAEAIQILNNMADPNALYVGQQLLIPGAEGTAVPLVYTVQVGDTLADIAAKFNTTTADIAQRNSLIQPAGLVAGDALTLLSRTGSATPQVVTGTAHIVQRGETLLAIAATYQLAPPTIAALNELAYPYRLYEGQRLHLPLAEGEYHALPAGWARVAMRPWPIRPGDTLAVFVSHVEEGQPTGSLVDSAGERHEMQFAPAPAGEGFVALVGLDAFAPTGRYTVELSGEGLMRPWWPFQQGLEVGTTEYGLQQINVSEELLPLLASEVRASEDEYLTQIFTLYTPEKQWEGPFQYPVREAVVTAVYGDSRSYNGGPVEIFHTGIDFGGTDGTPIFAPAQGTVIFTGTLNLRGQTLIVDHGWGVMTAYYHLSEILVQVGDVVLPGDQVMARGGSTGLSTGPHLHWDVRVNDAAVNPVRWVESSWP